jgi:hypothetical protein
MSCQISTAPQTDPATNRATQVREPTAAVFSAESMLRGMGVPLDWSMARPLEASGQLAAGGDDLEAAVGAAAGGSRQSALLQVGCLCWELVACF